MPRVENKCTNCRHFSECSMVSNNQVVIWKHCGNFKPSLEAIEVANEREKEAQKQKIIQELNAL